MITSLRLVNFKNFADETLKVGPFTVIVGANASGKSNLRDAFRFLHGISWGYTLAEIFGGKHGPGGQVEWEPIRGAPNEVVRAGALSQNVPPRFSLQLELNLLGENAFHSIEIAHHPDSPNGFLLLEESLRTESNTVYETEETDDSHLQLLLGDGLEELNLFDRFQPVLSNIFPRLGLGLALRLIERENPINVENIGLALDLKFSLAGMRFLDLVPARMREPAFPGSKLGDYGQNLPSVLEAICADSGRKVTLMSWLQELTPMDVKDFAFPRDPSGRVHLHIVERNGRWVSAYSASDGTLRFLALLAALLDETPAGLYFFEEIDNGIHPNRLWLLLDLIERQTAKGKIQVITTTHSPALLAWISDATFEHTSVVYRDEYWSDSVIRPVADLYNLRELRESQGLEGLLTGGWFETAMKFSEGDPDTDSLGDEDEDEDGDGESAE